MNGNLLSIVKQITAQYGEDILEDAWLLKALCNRYTLKMDTPKAAHPAFVIPPARGTPARGFYQPRYAEIQEAFMLEYVLDCIRRNQ